MADEPEVQPSRLDDLKAAFAASTETPTAADLEPVPAAAETGANEAEETGIRPDPVADPEAEPEALSLAALDTWPAATREAFDAFDDGAKRAMLDAWSPLETSHTERTTALDGLEKYKEIEELLAPHRDQFAAAGMSEAQGVKQLLAAQSFLARDPKGALQWLAKQSNVDLASLVPQNAAEAEDLEFTDPAVKALQGQVQQLTQYLNGQQAQSAQAGQQTAQDQITAFETAKDDAGALLHPHFQKVRKVMGSLVTGEAVATLDEAYDQAVWGNPALRQQALSDQAKATAATQTAAKAAKAAKAAASATGVKSTQSSAITNGDGRVDEGKRTRLDALKDAARQQGLIQ